MRLLLQLSKVIGGYVFASVGRYIGMFVNNFLAPIQVRLSPERENHGTTELSFLNKMSTA